VTAAAGLLVLTFCQAAVAAGAHDWNGEEVQILRSLWIRSLPPVPPDPSNDYADDGQAAELGRKFFFDTRFSGNKKVSCATCHREDYFFTDDLPLAHGMGTTARRTMPLEGTAYYPWLFWDGRKDSLWSQALGPLESIVEHGISRIFAVSVIKDHYEKEYESVFGPLPAVMKIGKLPARPAVDDPGAYKAWLRYSVEDRRTVNEVYSNFGKAIAAYVRTIMPGESRFDRYVAVVVGDDSGDPARILNSQEAEGLRLFIGRAKCTNCHIGPLFTNAGFHNLGIPPSSGMPFDPGRKEGIGLVLADEFNCLGPYSDASGKECQQLWYMDTDDSKYIGAMKTPTLRNVVQRPPYMHAGQFSTIREVLEFYRQSKNPEIGHQDLTDEDLAALEAFLGTLSGPILSLGGNEP
jgi:cytochrome c peroxidase